MHSSKFEEMATREKGTATELELGIYALSRYKRVMGTKNLDLGPVAHEAKILQ